MASKYAWVTELEIAPSSFGNLSGQNKGREGDGGDAITLLP